MKFLTIIIVKFIYYITAIELSAKGLKAILIQMTKMIRTGINIIISRFRVIVINRHFNIVYSWLSTDNGDSGLIKSFVTIMEMGRL